MNIVLINPPTSFDQIYGQWDLSGVDTYCPPLGLLYIASYLREHHHAPHVIDVQAMNWSCQETVECALSHSPDVVGISAKTINIHNAGEIAGELKSEGYVGPIVVGGAQITALPAETLGRFRAIDYGVIGEGEIAFLEVVENIKLKKPVRDVRGVVWRNGIEQTVVNPPRPLMEDLDQLPFPAWDLLVDFPDGYPHNALETKRLPSASIITSRGCPFQCTFCDRAVFGSRVRQHSAEYTLGMIRHLQEVYGIRDLMILDDNFMLDKGKLFTICDTIREERMDLSWFCQGHVKFMTDDRLAKMRDAGCWFVEMGIESGCDRILKLIKKNTNKAEIAEAVRRAHKAGLKVKGNFIFGLPTETIESLEETTQFAASIDLSYFQQNFMTLWPGCEIARNAERYGHVETDWDRLSDKRITFIPSGLSAEDLLKASKAAFRRFYLRPRILFEILLQSLTSWRAAHNAIVAFVAFLKTMSRPDRGALPETPAAALP